ncbi:MAG: hypothetical protein NTZ48_00810 [Candidatus Omnitrophica bacterium]|nr:hypothetical protein [Candidatus Omnitrophota bacterium]
MKYSKSVIAVWFLAIAANILSYFNIGFYSPICQNEYSYNELYRRVKFSRPGFDLLIQPADLFPDIGGAEVRTEQWESDEICVKLQRGGHNLAEVQIQITNELVVPDASVGDFEYNFGRALFNNGTERKKDEKLGVTVYSNLNWIALIKWLGKEPPASFSGRDWYLNFIEPYIKRSGVSIIGLFGSCIGDLRIYRFYQSLGFLGNIPMGITDDNYGIDGDSVKIKPVLFSLKELR